MPPRTISFLVGQLHLPFGFETETAQIGKQMPEDLGLGGDRKASELQHDRRVKRSDVAVPDIALNASEVDGGEATLETACNRHLWNAMALPQILKEKESIEAKDVTPPDPVRM